MNAFSKAASHPDLRKLDTAQRRLIRLLGLLFFLSMTGILMFMMTKAFLSRSVANLLLFALAGLVALPMIALMSGLLWYLERLMTRRITEADQLLRENSSLSAHLTPTGLHSKFGMLMAVRLLDRRTEQKPLFALIEPRFGWSRPPDREMTVQLYCGNLTPESRLVVLHDGKVLMGKLVEGKAHYRQMKGIAVGGAVALVSFAVAMGIAGIHDYRAGQEWQAASSGAIAGFLFLIALALAILLRRQLRQARAFLE